MTDTIEKTIVNVVPKYKCTLCSTCYNVCPSNAIEFIEDKDGFMYPSINMEKCTNCGLCRKKCPALNTKATSALVQRQDIPLSYAAIMKDEETRMNSSSGGVFSVLSKYVLDNHGYVVGAKFTGGGICEHVIVDNYDDINSLRGSKYVQSYINDTFSKIKTILEQENKLVLFTGTPCQVSGLYQVLGKDYENLITVDLLCHGCPSQKLFREWLNEISDGNEQEVKNIKFRDKSMGWRQLYFTCNIKGTPYRTEFYQTPYGKAFLYNISIRTSCTDCRFNRTPRQGDFTIGDFWGIEHIHKEYDDNKGISAILVNSKKAQKVLNKVKSSFRVLKKVPLSSISNYNMVSWKSYPHPNRPYFIDKCSKGDYTSVNELLTKSLEHKNGIAIINYGYSKNNYGSVLAAYALQEKIKTYGQIPVNITFGDMEWAKDMSNLFEFTKEHINFAFPCTSVKLLRDLNKYFKTFIVGPDCVWKDLGFMPDFYYNFLNFVYFSKNICSYAASFGSKTPLKYARGGKEDIEHTEEELYEIKRLLKRFSLVSVREKDGVDICRDYFDKEAMHVLDSVFFLSKEEWEKILPDKYKNQNDFETVRYILNWNRLPEGCIDIITKMPKYKSLYDGDTYIDIFIRGNDKKFDFKGPEIEDWLNSIKNAKMFFTDSFHGTCFALIFNVPFVCFPTVTSNYSRIESILEVAGLSDRTARSKEDMERIINTPIDWQKVNERIKNKLDISQKFFEKILELHNAPTPKEREYAESIEMLVNKLLCAKKEKPFRKEKIYFLSIPVFKKKLKHNDIKIYILGIPLFKIQNKGNNTYYRFLGIKIFKRRQY